MGTRPERWLVALVALWLGCTRAQIVDGGGPDAAEPLDGGAVIDASMDAGAADAPDGGGPSPDAPDPVDAGADAGPSYRLVGAPVAGALVGGTGGDPFGSVCATGEVVVGQSGFVLNGYPFRHSVHCAQLFPDGSVGSARVLSAVAGAAACGDSLGGWLQGCPPGSVAIGLGGRVVNNPSVGARVTDQLGLVCAPLATWVRDGSGAASLPLVGGSVGTMPASFDERCAAGHVLTGITGSAGCLLDALRIECTRVEP